MVTLVYLSLPMGIEKGLASRSLEESVIITFSLFARSYVFQYVNSKYVSSYVSDLYTAK